MVVRLLIIATLLAGCAATYEPPKTKAREYSAAVDADRSRIAEAARKVLVLDGYQVSGADGVLSTGPKLVALSALDADCGTTAGLPYIKDKRTITHVAYGVIAADKHVTIRTTIEGEYLKTHIIAGVAMQCVSTGRLERALLESIKQQL